MSDGPAITLECTRLWKVFGDKAVARLQGEQLPDQNEAVARAKVLKHDGGIVACGDINLKIHRGEFFVLMGLSGSGKSTLMRCMSRLTEPTAGGLDLDGEDFFITAAQAALRNPPQQDGDGVSALRIVPAHDGAGRMSHFRFAFQAMPVGERTKKGRGDDLPGWP